MTHTRERASALPHGGIPAAILKCAPLREVDKGSLHGQTLDPSILTEGASLPQAAL